MINIIIERSKDCMQVVKILLGHPEPIAELNIMQMGNRNLDLDLLYFKHIDDLNKFLFDNLKL